MSEARARVEILIIFEMLAAQKAAVNEDLIQFALLAIYGERARF
jgi:hypothetical protein